MMSEMTKQKLAAGIPTVFEGLKPCMNFKNIQKCPAVQYAGSEEFVPILSQETDAQEHDGQERPPCFSSCASL